MSQIKLLPEAVYKQIAAGEVITGPAAAVKELLENAADAGATAITVEIADGGRELIRVTDNGSGMSEDDLPLAVAKHATSKIQDFDDVYRLQSLGFRGEALSSMAQVARVTILSRKPQAMMGAKLTVEGGGEPVVSPAGGAEGTTVRVEDLFYNVPARRKFLKSGAKEGVQVSEAVRRMLLSRPDIAFKYIRNGRILYQTPGDGSLQSAISSVYGVDCVPQLMPVDFNGAACQVTGFVSKPTYIFRNRQRMDFFVNGRYVQSKDLQNAVIRGYGESLFHGHYPMAVLSLSLDPGELDINVHPAKLAVLFTRAEEIERDVANAAREALGGAYGAPFLEVEGTRKEEGQAEAPWSQQTVGAETPPPADGEQPRASLDMGASGGDMEMQHASAAVPGARATQQERLDLNWEPSDSEAEDFAGAMDALDESGREQASGPVERDIREVKEFTVLGSVFASYLVCEAEGRVFFVDQHAARERLTYEKMLAWAREGRRMGQLLLAPLVRILPEPEFEALVKNAELLASIGLDFERFGEFTLRFTALPVQIAPDQVDSFLASVQEELKSHREDPVAARERIISSACRHSVKAGTQLTDEEMRSLMCELSTMDSIPFCPHGRPVAVEITREQLEKGFRRRQ